MVEVKIVVGNEELGLISGRLAAFQKSLAGDMISGQESAKVMTATATHAFTSRLLRQLGDHQLRLEELERQEREKRDRIRAGKRDRR